MLNDETREKVRKNPAFLKDLADPDEELMLYAVRSAWNNAAKGTTRHAA